MADNHLNPRVELEGEGMVISHNSHDYRASTDLCPTVDWSWLLSMETSLFIETNSSVTVKRQTESSNSKNSLTVSELAVSSLATNV